MINFDWILDIFKKKKKSEKLMKLLPKVIETEELTTNGNGRHHHYKLATEISKIKSQIEENDIDLLAIKILLGDKFFKARTLIVKSMKMIEEGNICYKKAKQLVVDARNLV